ncbi:MAG: HEAT repeat domain-containing protein, partial [Planctomycetota bacterium]
VPHQKSGEEWFWADRLCSRPEPLPELPADPAWAQELDRAMSEIRKQPLTDAGQALQSLIEKGEALIPCLLPYLRHQDKAVRWAAATALSRIGGSHCVSPLLTLLRDEWDAVAILAATTLSRCPEPWIIPRLLKALGPYPVDYCPHLIVRVKAAALLVKLGDCNGIPFLIKVLKDNTPAADPEREWDENPRLAWAKEESLAALKEITGEDFGFSPDASIFDQAKAALRFEAWWQQNRDTLWQRAPLLDDRLLQSKIRDLIAGLASFQARNADGARYCLKMLGPPVFPYLAGALVTGGFYERFHSLDIVIALAPLAGKQAESWSETILPLLEDKAPAVRMKAVRTLGFLERETAITALEKALDDPDPDVSLCAVESLGRIQGERAQSLLVSIVNSKVSVQKKVEAKAALVRCSKEYIPSFLEEWLNEDPIRREYAIQKMIDLLGDDFDFDLDVAPSERRAVAESLTSRLEALPRRR